MLRPVVDRRQCLSRRLALLDKTRGGARARVLLLELHRAGAVAAEHMPLPSSIPALAAAVVW